MGALIVSQISHSGILKEESSAGVFGTNLITIYEVGELLFFFFISAFFGTASNSIRSY